MPLDAKFIEGGRDTFFELSKSIKLFKDALLEILEVERQAALTNSVAFTDRLVAFPAADSSTFQFDELLHKSFLGRAILFGMHGDWKSLISNLVGFDKGFKVHTALILIKPILAIELQIGTSVVDFPSIVEPARALSISSRFLNTFFTSFMELFTFSFCARARDEESWFNKNILGQRCSRATALCLIGSASILPVFKRPT